MIILTTTTQSKGPFELEPLKYPYNALEPHIDALTMEIHHTKHHAGYVSKLNAAIKGTEAENWTLGQILANTKKFGMGVRNNLGGTVNHNLFFATLSPNGGGQPSGELANAISSAFGNFDNFKTQLNNAGATRFGSGWAWLYVNSDKKLAIGSTPNQDNPMMDIAEIRGIPVFGIDVWEHAYYLRYQNRRPEYLEAIWNVIDWDEVARQFTAAMNA